MPKRILAVVAHPDDEVIGVAGALINHARNGDEVHILILADGETSREPSHKADDLVEKRMSRAHKVGKIIGAKSVTCLSLPDNELDTLSRLQLAKIVEAKVDELAIQTIYTHHRWDVNIDHQMAHEAVVIASRSMPGQTVKTILFFETASSTEWQPPNSGFVFSPNWFVDVTDVWNEKISALKVYDEEMRNFPHTRSYEAIEALAKWRGASAGLNKAEAFMIGRHIED